MIFKNQFLIPDFIQNLELFNRVNWIEGRITMRIIGLDLGKVSFKAVWLEKKNNQWQVKKTFWKVHQQEIIKVWQELRDEWQISDEDTVVVTGKHRDILFPLPRIVEEACQKEAVRFLYPEQDLTLIRLGGGGFSVMNIKASGQSEFRRNPRCAAGTGSFLDQLIGPGRRFDFENIAQADQAAKDVESLEMTRRCGVTMKTEATHLANEGAPKERIVAALLDSLAKSALALAQQTEIAPRVLIIGRLSALERIVRTIREGLPKEVKVEVPKEAKYFEALGAALIGKRIVEEDLSLPEIQPRERPLVYFEGLKKFQDSVTRMEPPKYKEPSLTEPLIFGFDIGSTGSKLVGFGLESNTPVFETYVETKGQPVEAAKKLVQKIPQQFLTQIRAAGCTGSGREIVAGLLKASLPKKDQWRIFYFNEIAAHAEGAHWYDPEVDSIVDLGGQDAKFTILESGRVIDSCMNTVCSAGTGSFLEEQVELLGIKNVKELGRIAMKPSRAAYLGQHCAVFISEQIDETRRKGATLPEIIAGLYDSISRNYAYRVKGSKEWGKRIFLQGKPAENIALACALAAVTGNKIIVPPSPGIPGALGIALLAKKELGENLAKEPPLDFKKFFEAEVIAKGDFRCLSKKGCRDGNHCLIKKIKVKIGQEQKLFLWGGDCDLYEQKPGKNPEIAKGPHPFQERENLISSFLRKKSNKPPGLTVAIPRGLETEEILPLIITFFQELGFEAKLQKSLSMETLEEGAKLCQATFCAPLQLLAGQAKLQEDADYIFLPKVIEIAGITEEPEKERCYVCPVSQVMPDMFSPKLSTKILQPFLNFKQGYQENQEEFLKMGSELGCSRERAESAFKKAVEAQEEFELDCQDIGLKALDFAEQNKIPTVVVLGHPYIINASLLSAGIPEAIQENGAVALPAGCYPLIGQDSLPKNIYWGYGQRLLQAAFEIRRQPDVYPLWLSVYSCGPDSFLLHFFQYISQGKPYTILESDAYTGQAGFKTRVEAFLYGVKNYQPKEDEVLTELQHFDEHEDLAKIKASKHKMLVPWMGESSRTMAALFRSIGIECEALSLSNQENLEFGRKYTSGKECLPMIITLGGLLKHLKAHSEESFYYFMPQASGPCRFGNYQLLFKIILEKLGLAEKVKVLSPTSETGYQYELQIGTAAMAKAWAVAVFTDFLKDALYDIRPEEKHPGLTQQIFDLYLRETEEIAEKTANNWFGLKDLWGLRPLAEKAAGHFQKISRDNKKQGKPIVLLTGEIYVRLDSFANNETIRELENLGVKVKLSPFREWINYVTYLRQKGETLVKASPWKVWLTNRFQRKIEKQLYQIFAQALDWPEDHHMEEILGTAEPYLSRLKPLGEAALTIGLPLLLWQKKEIDGAVIIGPFECMPSRIAEAQLNLISQKTGLPVLNLSFYGDPLDRDILESFVWDLRK